MLNANPILNINYVLSTEEETFCQAGKGCEIVQLNKVQG